MSDRPNKWHPESSSCGPTGGDSVLTVLKPANWLWNLFYYLYTYATHIYKVSLNMAPCIKN
jgi:hypothetical protein